MGKSRKRGSSSKRSLSSSSRSSRSSSSSGSSSGSESPKKRSKSKSSSSRRDKKNRDDDNVPVVEVITEHETTATSKDNQKLDTITVSEEKEQKTKNGGDDNGSSKDIDTKNEIKTDEYDRRVRDNTDEASTDRRRRKRNKHRKRRKDHKRRHHRSRKGYSSDSSSSSDNESEDDESNKHKRKKHRHRSRSSRHHHDDDSVSSSSRRRRRKHKKDKKRRKNDTKKTSLSCAQSSFGKYGIIRQSDFYTQRRSFEAWMTEIKKIPSFTGPKYELMEYFKEFCEDYNTVTLPHTKYYNYDKWEMEEYEKQKELAGDKTGGVISDEARHLQDMQKMREEKLKKEQEMIIGGMNKGKIEEMKNQARMKREMEVAFRMGDQEKVKRLQRRLEPEEKRF